MVRKLVLLACAGALGTLARYLLASAAHRLIGPSFPWGTLVVNATGCFVAGILWTLFNGRLPVTPETRLIVFVGFMGAFTTFSAYIVETGELARTATYTHAAANMIAQNALGIMALIAGAALGRYV